MNLIYSNPSIYYVYAYLRSKNTKYGLAGTPYYIGKGKGPRAYKQHRYNNSGVHVPKDKRFIVFLETNLTELGAFALERRYVSWYGTRYDNTGILRNLTKGGPGAPGRKFNHSEETISKIKKSNTGKKRTKPISQETLLKMHLAKMGKAKSEETKAKMRKPKTVEHSKNISIGRKGIEFTQNHKVAISLAAAKHRYKLISPTGEIFETHSIKRFCIDRNIDYQKFKNMRNKGIIPVAYDNSSVERINATGWTVFMLS